MQMNDDGISPLADHGRELRMTMPGLIQSAGRAGAYVAGGEWGKIRASDSDRDGVVEVLNVAFSEGRLSKAESDGRVESALSARTHAGLDQIVTDLPAARATAVTPVTGINGLAVASLACGLAQLVWGPRAATPAIVLGHAARRQNKHSGEQGAGLALAGLIFGWAAVILGVLLVLGVAMSVG